MAYRNELAAAQSRGLALERELEAVRRQLAEQGEDENTSAWSRLVLSGASEEKRARDLANRRHQKAAAKAHKRAIAQKRSALRAARFNRFDERRRSVRSTTRWGWCAHWVFPLLLTSPWLCAFVLFILVPWTLWILLAWFAFASAVWALSNLWALSTSSRAAARLKALPFAVKGHDVALGRDFRDLKLALRFAAKAPSAAQMQRWVLGLAAETRSSSLRSSIRNTSVGTSDHAHITLSPKEPVTRWMAGNRSYYRWHRKVVEAALVELHSTFPIESVKVTLDK